MLERTNIDDDVAIISLVLQLHLNQIVRVGNTYIDANKGAAHGSVLSPILFNLLLHEALNSSPLLSQIIIRGDLSAYAYDMSPLFEHR